MKPLDISTSFQQTDSDLLISGVSLIKIIDDFGTPLYVYDAETIRRRYNHLRENLPPEIDIFYAMKANPNKAIVRLLTNLGTGVEVASRGELLLCEELGIDPDNIVFAGPSKTIDDLTKAIDLGIYSINVESLQELRRISRLSQQRGKTTSIELRLNPEFHVDGAVVNMGGGSQKFGIDIEMLPAVLEAALRLPNIHLNGIHVFSATGILGSEGFLGNLENCVGLAERVNSHYPVLSLDVGGGLGIPYKDGEVELSISGINERIQSLFDRYKFLRDNNTRVILEPGRYLVGQSGVYISRVEYTKKSRGEDYVLTDGGVHQLLRPALLRTSHPTFNLSRRTEETGRYNIGGTLCTPIDFIARGIELPRDTQEGDLIGAFCSGAYGYTESMPLFLSHDMPSEVLVHDGRYSEIRQPTTVEEVLRKQRIPREL